MSILFGNCFKITIRCRPMFRVENGCAVGKEPGQVPVGIVMRI